ncbi:MAG: hypothetical protein ABIJ47_01295 [Candidatus Bathyarchaeota archaeon]
MRLKILALLLLAVLLAAPFAIVVNAEADNGVGESTQSDENIDGNVGSGRHVSQEVYESMRAAAEERRDQAFSMLEKDIPLSALNSLKMALDAMDEAQEAHDTQASAQLYLQALKHFRNAWNHLEGDDVNLKLLLGEADEETNPVDELDPGLEEGIKEAKQQLLNRFQSNFQERLDSMYSHVEDLEGMLSSGDSAKVETALTKAREKLLSVQEKLQRGAINEALDDLDVTTQELDKDFDGMEDDDASEMFKNVDKLEARIQRMENKKDKSGDDDETGDDAVINELKAKIQKNKVEFKENKGKPENNGKPEDNGNNGNNGNNGKPEDNGNNGNNGNNGKPEDTGKPENNGTPVDNGKPEDNGNNGKPEDNGNNGNNGNNGKPEDTGNKGNNGNPDNNGQSRDKENKGKKDK